MATLTFSPEERKLFLALYHKLLKLTGESFLPGDIRNLKQLLIKSIASDKLQRDIFGLHPMLKSLQSAIIVADEIGMKRASVLGIMLHEPVSCGIYTLEEISQTFGLDVSGIVRGLIRVHELYVKSPSIESDNFRKLLLTFAEDMRVILLIIADRVNIMRQIRDTENNEARLQVANEAAYLYAPLAHKLGLYVLKSEL